MFRLDRLAKILGLAIGIFVFTPGAHAAFTAPATSAQSAQGRACTTAAPAGAYYLQGDCTPVALDMCAKPGVDSEFIELLNTQGRLPKRVVMVEQSHVRAMDTPVADFTCHMVIAFADGSRQSGILNIKNHYSTYNGVNTGSPITKVVWRVDCWAKPGIQVDVCPKKNDTRAPFNWKFLGNGNGFSVYMDQTIRGHGAITPEHPVTKNVAMLIDYQNAQLDMALPYLSSVSLMQYDCAAGQEWNPQTTTYDAHMAEGFAVIEQTFPAQWDTPPKGSIAGANLEVVCKSQPKTAEPTRSESYRTGQADRVNFNNWIASQREQYFEGAKYLADLFFKTGSTSGNCMEHWSDNNAWTLGCNEAVKQLAVPSVRRRSDTEYRLGWDSNTSPLSP